MATALMCHYRMGSQEAPAQPPGALATWSPAEAAPRTGLAASSPGSPCEAAESQPLRFLRVLEGRETGPQDPRPRPCDTSLLFVLPSAACSGSRRRASPSSWGAVHFRPARPPCSLCGALPGPRLRLLCLQSCSLRTWGQAVTECAEQGARASSPPASLCPPLLQLGSALASRLDSVRKSGEMRSRGAVDWHLDLPPSASCSSAQCTWVKKTKKRGCIHILFLFHGLGFHHQSRGSRGPS